MIGRDATLKVKIISDATEAAAGFEKTSGMASKFAKGAKIAGGTLLVTAGAAKVAWDQMISPAGELEQSVGAVDAVFKGNAKQVHSWAKGAATDVGLARNEYNELATILGAQLKNGGTSLDQLGGKTNDLIGVGSDLSAMFGGTTADAVGALSSALKGERDPIERYGVSLNQAKIDAEAAALGFKKVGGSLSAEANQAATLSLIMKQTKDAHGAFGRESDTLAHKQQVFAAQVDNVKAKLGTALLPVATKVFGFLADKAVPAVTKLVDSFSNGKAADFAKRLGLDKLPPIFRGVVEGVRSFASSWSSSSTKISGSGVPGFMQRVATAARSAFAVFKTASAVVVPLVVTAFKTIGPPVLEVVKSVLGLVQAVAQRLVPVIRFLAPFVQQAFANIINVVRPVLQFIAALIRTVTAVIKGDWSGAWNGIKDMFAAVWNLIKAIVSNAINTVKLLLSTAWTGIKAAAAAAWNGIKALIGLAWQGIKAAVSLGINAAKSAVVAGWNLIKSTTTNVWNGIKAAIALAWSTIKTNVTAGVNAAKAVVSAAWNAIKTTSSAAWNGIKTVVTSAVEALKSSVTTKVAAVKTLFTNLPSSIKSAFGNAASMLSGIGKSIIDGLINGIKSKIASVKSTLTDLTSQIPDWKGPLPKDKRLLEPAGAAIMGGLIRSIEEQVPELRRTLRDVTGEVAGTRISGPALLPPGSVRAAAAGVGTARSSGRAPVKLEVNFNGVVDRTAAAREIINLLRAHNLLTGEVVP